MYIKPNFLKTNLFFFLFILLINSCKPTELDEQNKIAMGYYSYNIGDTILLKNNNKDTFLFYLHSKISNFLPDMITGNSFETFNLEFLEKNNSNNSFSIYNNYLSIGSFILIYSNPTFFEKIDIDKVIFDSVYYIEDIKNNSFLYSNNKYGFIKLWNKTDTLKFFKY